MFRIYKLTFVFAILLYPGFIISQNIQINFPAISQEQGGVAYLMKPRGFKMDTVTQGEFNKGIVKLKCDECLKGLYMIGVSGIQEPTFLLLNKLNLNMSVQLDVYSKMKVEFKKSEANTMLYKILANNAKYHAKRDSLNQYAQTIYEFDKGFKQKVKMVRSAYNKLHVENSLKLEAFDKQTSDEYLSKVLIPVLKFISYNSEVDEANFDTERAFLHYNFFKLIDFSQAMLAGDYFFAKKLNEYIIYFGGRGTQGKQESVGLLVELSNTNSKVQGFVIESLLETFYNMQDVDMVEYISGLAVTASCEAPQLSGELKKFVEGTQHLQPGKMAPDISLKDPEGKYQLLSQTVKSHKATIVLFWASWCSHCVDMLPKLQSIYPQLQEKGVEIYAVALDENKEEWINALAKNKIQWINVSEQKKWKTQAVSDYNVRATPALFLLSDDMTIVGKYNIFEDFKAAVGIH